MFVQYVSLEPNLGVEHCADCQWCATQRSLVHKYFKFHPVQVEMNPEKLTSGKRILQRPESDDAA